MTQFAAVASSPIAMIAEDNVYIREDTVRRLRRRGINAIPVGSFRQAAEALNLVGPIDVAVLDIHLAGDHSVNDKGGVEIARLLRTTREEMHIVGYSGHFGDDDISSEERRLFDRTFAKGSNLTRDERQSLWDDVADTAVRVAADRMAHTLEQQDKLRRLYESEFPRSSLFENLDFRDAGRKYTAEGALGLQGFSLRVVSPRPDESRQPILVWHNTVQDAEKTTWHNLEAYGYPDIYSSNLSFSEAVEDLFVHLTLLRDALTDVAELDANERELLNYCAMILNQESAEREGA